MRLIDQASLSPKRIGLRGFAENVPRQSNREPEIRPRRVSGMGISNGQVPVFPVGLHPLG